jgi:hypothetical protein
MEVLAMSVWTRISRLTINDRVTHRVPHEDQELLTILEHPSSSPVFDCVYVLPVFFFGVCSRRLLFVFLLFLATCLSSSIEI